MKRLAIITTHPIQYNAPLFRLLHDRENLQIKVFYTWGAAAFGAKYDPGFKQSVHWDIPLLDGYPYCFVENTSTVPGSHHYKGIDNPSLISEIRAWKADAVMVYGWNFKSHLTAMRFFHRKIPVLFRGDSTLLDETPGIKQLLRRLYLKYVYTSVDIALYAGKANRAYFLKHGIKEKQLVYMPHATDNDRFAGDIKNNLAGTALREKLGIRAEASVFLFAGKLEPKKQPDVLLKIFSAIGDTGSYLIVAGSGEMEGSLKKLYGDNENIKFIGFQNQQQMPAVYAACDVLVFPSRGPGETWGLAVNEAMAAGKPVISSTACGASYDLIINGNNGFVIDKKDNSGLKKSILYFIENKEEISTMGKRSAEIIKDYSFTNDCMAIENALMNNITFPGK